jgi:phosphonate transport system substrate-binding protein
MPRALALLLAGLLAFLPDLPVAAAPSAPARDTLVIGSISDNLTRETRTFAPLAGYLGERLRGAGLRGAEVAVVASADELAAGLASGAIDLYIDSPFIVADIARRTGAVPFLRRWKGGVAEYHSVFFARADSALGALDDLRGRAVAFDEPYSTSGYLLPRSLLLERGYRLAELARADAAVPPDAIGYTFSGDDSNTVLWVVRGKVAAGVTDSRTFAKLSAKKPGELRVLGRSADVPRQAVAHRAGLEPGVVAELERILTGMEHDAAGREALGAFEETTRFDRFPGGADAAFAPIRAALERPSPPAGH